jgi:hypothetical protein
MNSKTLFTLNRIKCPETILGLRENNIRIHILNEEELCTCSSSPNMIKSLVISNANLENSV